MKTEIQPHESNRAEAFRLWMSSPMPMVTLVKTLDVSRLIKVSKKRGMKFTMLMCWCVGKAASQVEEFFTLPVSFQFHHVQMDGGHAARFLDILQKEISKMPEDKLNAEAKTILATYGKKVDYVDFQTLDNLKLCP